MSTVLSEPVAPPPLESLPRKKWTVCEIEELLSKGSPAINQCRNRIETVNWLRAAAKG